jgi:hypothetical protein
VENGAEPTATPLDTNIEDRPLLDPGSIETGFLNAGKTDRWPYQVNSAQTITVSVASERGLDVSVSLAGPDGQVIARQNSALNGQAEIMGGIELPIAGTYHINVIAPANDDGDYAILVYERDGYPFHFQGVIDYGQTRQGTIVAESDHVWHFSGQTGEIITINATPSGESDLILRLFGPDGLILIEYINDNLSGTAERLISYSLPDSGLYSLVVGEFDFGPAVYQIDLNKR